MRPVLMRVWADIASAAKCKWCRRPIVFRTTDRGRQLPFNATATPYDAVSIDDAGRRWEMLRTDDIHKCEQRPKTAPSRATREQRWAPIPPQRRFF